MATAEVAGKMAIAAIDQPGVDQEGRHADLARGEVMPRVVADHQALFRREADFGGDIVKVVGLRLAEAAVLESRHQVKGEIGKPAPGQTGRDDGPGEDRVGGDGHLQTAIKGPLQDRRGQRQCPHQRGQIGEAVADKVLESLGKLRCGEPGLLLQDGQQALFIIFPLPLTGQQGVDRGAQRPGKTLRCHPVGKMAAEPADIGGDKFSHVDLQQGAVEVEEYTAKRGQVSVRFHDRSLSSGSQGEDSTAAAENPAVAAKYDKDLDFTPRRR